MEVIVFLDIEVRNSRRAFEPAREIGFISENGERCSLEEGNVWTQFQIEFRKKFKGYSKVYVVAHNGLRFDFMYMVHFVGDLNRLHPCLQLVDSLEILTKRLSLESYDLLHVYHNVFGRRPSGLHSAIGDAFSLAQVFEKLDLYPEVKKHGFSVKECGPLYRSWVISRTLIENASKCKKRKRKPDKPVVVKKVKI